VASRTAGRLTRFQAGPPPRKRERPAPGGTGNRAVSETVSSTPENSRPDGSVQGETCTATLRPTGPRTARGILVGHPAMPEVHTCRDGAALAIWVTLEARIFAQSILVLDLTESPPIWSGEVKIDGTRWWASSALGSGVLTFSCPRRRWREVAL